MRRPRRRLDRPSPSHSISGRDGLRLSLDVHAQHKRVAMAVVIHVPVAPRKCAVCGLGHVNGPKYPCNTSHGVDSSFLTGLRLSPTFSTRHCGAELEREAVGRCLRSSLHYMYVGMCCVGRASSTRGTAWSQIGNSRDRAESSELPRFRAAHGITRAGGGRRQEASLGDVARVRRKEQEQPREEHVARIWA